MKYWMKVCVVGLVVYLGLLTNVGFTADLKNVMVLYRPATEFFADQAQQALEQAGFVDQQNVTIVRVPVSAADDLAQLAARVQAAPPDVLIRFVPFTSVHDLFESLSIPVITHVGVERFVNADGVPTANVTGVYTTLPDMIYNSYKFLQKVAPLKAEQQVVFLDNQARALISKEVVEDALYRLQIPLKTIVDASLFEDWQQAILQYNDDPDVGWILMGSTPTRRRDGSQIDPTGVLPWMREHLQKPSVAYWERSVQMGMLCGFCIDLDEVGVQIGEMAARVLQGEDVRTIKAEYPRKVSIALNRKTATNLGIIFSLDVLGLANVIYDDYEDKQVIRK